MAVSSAMAEDSGSPFRTLRQRPNRPRAHLGQKFRKAPEELAPREAPTPIDKEAQDPGMGETGARDSR